MDAGITINRPPRDGRMAFVRSPDNISIELLQDGPGPYSWLNLGCPCQIQANGKYGREWAWMGL